MLVIRARERESCRPVLLRATEGILHCIEVIRLECTEWGTFRGWPICTALGTLPSMPISDKRYDFYPCHPSGLVVTSPTHLCGNREFDSCQRQNVYSGACSGKRKNASK